MNGAKSHRKSEKIGKFFRLASPSSPASQSASQPASKPALSSELSSEVASSGRSAFAGWLLRSFSSGKTTPLPRNKDEWSKKSFCFLLKFDEIADSSGFWVLKNLVIVGSDPIRIGIESESNRIWVERGTYSDF